MTQCLLQLYICVVFFLQMTKSFQFWSASECKEIGRTKIYWCRCETPCMCLYNCIFMFIIFFSIAGSDDTISNDLQPFAILNKASVSLQGKSVMKLAAPSLLNDYCKIQILHFTHRYVLFPLFLYLKGKAGVILYFYSQECAWKDQNKHKYT